MAFIISDFRAVRPAHVRSQAGTLEWLRAAHVEAERTRAARGGRPVDEARLDAQLGAALARFGCSDGRIATRGYELDDCDHTRWDEMEIYRLHEEPRGAGTLARTRAFERMAGAMFEEIYEPSALAPSDLLHVTCTGYASPSPAQALVSRRGWGAATRVTHVYHMGCYAAFPALRLAAGARAGLPEQRGARARSEIVHTELCSLHLDPSNHAAEQLVIQTLFADGGIAYAVTHDADAELRAPGFELLALRERTLPDSGLAMTWRCSEWGMQMTLARDVPERLGGALGSFLDELLTDARLAPGAEHEAIFAVHPGGPRILDRVQDLLRLEDPQLEHSRKVLRERGNMSSATLPHVWLEVASDARIPAETHVVTLAFGPGLTLCGAVLRKIAP